ncbi:hypothetical protein, partial [Defluviimonas sp. WL0075]
MGQQEPSAFLKVMEKVDSHLALDWLIGVMQNISHAVMAQRHEPKDSPDDFPTPPWATRALLQHVIRDPNLSRLTCLEPACGRCPSSEDLGHEWLIWNGGPGSFGFQFMLRSGDAASGASRWFWP